MAYVTRAIGSGLVLQEQSASEAGLRLALKQIDERLVLHAPDEFNGPYWRVYRVWSEEHPAACVCTWMDADGNPLPLSSGILAEVDRLRLDARNKGPSAEERNAKRVEDVQREREQISQAIVEDHRARVERARMSVGMSTSNRRRGGLKK